VYEVEVPEGVMGTAIYLAVLAYPGPDEIPKRDRFIEAVKAMVHKDIVKIPELPKHIRQMRNREIDSALYRAANRISTRRIPAAKILWRLIANVKVNGGDPVHSIYGAINAQLESGRIEIDEANLRRIVWRESLPVIHLAYSFLWSGEGRGHNLVQAIKSPEWLIEAMKQAESVRSLLTDRNIISSAPFSGLLNDVKSVRLFTLIETK